MPRYTQLYREAADARSLFVLLDGVVTLTLTLTLTLILTLTLPLPQVGSFWHDKHMYGPGES